MWKLYKKPINYDEKNNLSELGMNQHISEYSKIAMLETKIKTLESQLNNQLVSIMMLLFIPCCVQSHY